MSRYAVPNARMWGGEAMVDGVRRKKMRGRRTREDAMTICFLMQQLQ